MCDLVCLSYYKLKWYLIIIMIALILKLTIEYPRATKINVIVGSIRENFIFIFFILTHCKIINWCVRLQIALDDHLYPKKSKIRRLQANIFYNSLITWIQYSYLVVHFNLSALICLLYVGINGKFLATSVIDI